MAKVEEGSAGEAAPADEDAPERADPTPALIDGGGGLPAAVTATDETKPSPRAEEEEALSDHYNAPENQPPNSKLAVTGASSEVRESDTLAQINVGLEC